MLHDLALVAGEVSLAVLAMALLVAGVYLGEKAARGVSWAALVALVFAASMVVSHGHEPGRGFADMFITDRFAVTMKLLVMLGSALAIVMSLDFLRRTKVERFEFPILIVL